MAFGATGNRWTRGATQRTAWGGRRLDEPQRPEDPADLHVRPRREARPGSLRQALRASCGNPADWATTGGTAAGGVDVGSATPLTMRVGAELMPPLHEPVAVGSVCSNARDHTMWPVSLSTI